MCARWVMWRGIDGMLMSYIDVDRKIFLNLFKVNKLELGQNFGSIQIHFFPSVTLQWKNSTKQK
jgi:hypothetical protein